MVNGCMERWKEGRKAGQKEEQMDVMDYKETSKEHIIQYSQKMECSGYHNILINRVLLPNTIHRFDY